MLHPSEEKERSKWLKLLWFRIPFRVASAAVLFIYILPALPAAIHNQIYNFAFFGTVLGIPASIGFALLLHRSGYAKKDPKIMFIAMIESCAKVILFPLVIPAYMMNLWGYEPTLDCALALFTIAGYAAFELFVELAYLKYTVFVREINIRVTDSEELASLN